MDQRPEPLDPAPDATVLPSAGVPLDPADEAFPPRAQAPAKVDFGDGVRLTRRSMVLVVLVALVPVMAAIGVAVLLSLGTGGSVAGDRGQSVSDNSDSGDSGDSRDSGDNGNSGDNGDNRDNGDNGDGKSAAEGDGGGPDGGTGVTKTAVDDAGDALRSADVRRVGSVEAAWTWRDGDTVTLVAVARRVARRNSNLSPRAVTLRVITVVDPQGRAKVLASSEDEGQTCVRGVEMKAEVAPSAIAVRDLDGDGSREAVVSWQHACGSDVQRRVTVLAGPSVYLLGGRGALLAEPDPPSADWPDGFLDAASEALD